jgi:hypothetical protein
MKKYLFLAATALMFAACSNNEVDAPQVTETNTTPDAIAFDTYTASSTRSGETGVMNTTTLQTTGFGVFGYLSDNGTWYDSSRKPNFMYNQKVEYSSAAWTYAPLKYWPNETTKDSQTSDGPATSTATDRLTFFAYAPYVSESGTLSAPGITALPANNTGDMPFISYAIAEKPSQSVDLLWGVAPTGGLNYKSVNPEAPIAIDQYKPLEDLIKPAKDQKIKFLFQHSLARLGVSVVAAVDQIAPGGSLDNQTKIAIESIVITDNSKVGVSGKLNLRNTAWSPVGTSIAANAKAGLANWSQTVKGLSLTLDKNNELYSEFQCKFNSSDEVDFADTWTNKDGVTTSEHNAIATKGDKDQYFMVIPSHEDTKFTVTITYYVITKDTKLDGDYAVTKNVITKDVTITEFTNNKAYNLKLILGLTSVKLDAEVADWQVDGSTEVNLPRNNE